MKDSINRLREISATLDKWQCILPSIEELEGCRPQLNKVILELDVCRDTTARNELLLQTVTHKCAILEKTICQLTVKTSSLEKELSISKSLLRLYDLFFLFNVYFTVPIIKEHTELASWNDFTNAYYITEAKIEDGDIDSSEMSTLISPVNSQLGDVDVKALIEVCRERHQMAHTDFRSAKRQREFLSSCKQTPFAVAEHAQLADVLTTHLDSVEFKRIC